jgi:predicted Fe-Mo cluster-binding NifX family protein
MRIAIPVSEGQLAQHFGHCERFALLDVDTDKREITASMEVDAPEHQPGLLPAWLKARGVNLVIAGGMGSRALSHFAAASIQVLTGAPTATTRSLVEQYLAGTLVSGASTCNHSGGGHRCRA